MEGRETGRNPAGGEAGCGVGRKESRSVNEGLAEGEEDKRGEREGAARARGGTSL